VDLFYNKFNRSTKKSNKWSSTNTKRLYTGLAGILNIASLRPTIACRIKRCIALVIRIRKYGNGSRRRRRWWRKRNSTRAHARWHGRVSREWCHVTGADVCGYSATIAANRVLSAVDHPRRVYVESRRPFGRDTMVACFGLPVETLRHSTAGRFGLRQAASEWVGSFLTAHQHIIDYSMPWSCCSCKIIK